MGSRFETTIRFRNNKLFVNVARTGISYLFMDIGYYWYDVLICGLWVCGKLINNVASFFFIY